MKLIAIDPGNTKSGYVVVKVENGEICKVLDRGKVQNDLVFDLFLAGPFELAVEMIASYGMPVGVEVFETCVWIGRFVEAARASGQLLKMEKIYRKDEKMVLCGTMKAKDSNIIQALVDRYAPGQPNRGKGTKKAPGFFHGFSRDAWQAMAVAVTYVDKYIGREGKSA